MLASQSLFILRDQDPVPLLIRGPFGFPHAFGAGVFQRA